MILLIEAVSPQTQLWLAEPAAVTSPRLILVWDSGRSLADELLGHIVGVLAEAKLALAEVSGIVLMGGPGSFTSLRIGHTVANALADSLGVPVVNAVGSGWQQEGLAALKTASSGRPVLPHYGAEPNITAPRT